MQTLFLPVYNALRGHYVLVLPFQFYCALVGLCAGIQFEAMARFIVYPHAEPNLLFGSPL